MKTKTSSIAQFSYGTGWTAPALPNWRLVALDGSGNYPWQYAANVDSSIDTYRRGDCRITVVNSVNAPIAGATILATQTEHSFPFGNTINNGLMCDSTDIADGIYTPNAFSSFRAVTNITAQDRQTYRDKVVNFGWNAWKQEASWGHGAYWSGPAPGGKECTKACTDWLINKTGKKWVELSAHAILYPLNQGWLFPSNPFGNTVAEKRAYWRNVDWPERAAYLDKFVDAYSLSNELGDSFYTPTNGEKYKDPDYVSDMLFAQTLTKRRGMVLDYINNFSLIEQAEFLISQGVKVDTVGWQAHETGGINLANTLNMYGWFNKTSANTPAPWSISIAEHDSRGISRAAKADNLEYTFKAGFSNPACESIYMWGFWEPVSWLYEVFGEESAGLFDRDWNITPSGQRFHDLVNVAWKTSSTGTTNGSGYHQFRGTFGRYDLTVTSGPTTVNRSFELHPGMREIVIVIP